MSAQHNHPVPRWTQPAQDGTDLTQASIHTRQSAASRPSAPSDNATGIGAWEWQLSTNRVTCPPETVRILGLPPESCGVTFDCFLSSVHEADHPRVTSALRTALSDRRICHLEYRIVTPAGTIRWISCYGRPVITAAGTVSGMAGVVEDVTQRKDTEFALQELRKQVDRLVRERTASLEQAVVKLKSEITRREQAEAALKESEQRYQSLYENNPSMYFTLSREGTVLSVNQFGAEQLGYRQEDLVGRSVLCVFDTKDHEAVLGQLTVCAENPNRIFEWELQKVRKDRSRLWVRERARAITDPQGTLTILVVCEDVTDHRKTTQLLSTLVRESPLPIVSLDADARVTTWNQAATSLFGWTAEEVLGRELPYVPLGQEGEAEALWEQGTRDMMRGPIALRRQRKDGALLDVLLWPVFIYDEAEQLSTAVGLYVDQSDVQRAEAARLHSEERLRSFLNALDDLAFEMDARGTYLNVWTRNDNNLMLPRQHIIGRNLSDIFGAVESARYLEAIQRVLATGQPEPVEYECAIKDHLRYFSAIISRIPATGDAAATVACVVRDVTPRKQIEKALRESEERFRQIAETIEEVVWSADPTIGKMLYISPAYERIWGRTCASLYTEPKSFIKAIHPDDRTRVLAHLSVQQQGLPFAHEYRVVRPDGEIRWVWDRGFPVVDPATGTLTHYVGVALDITERKQAEEDLRVSEERFAKAFRSSPHPIIVTERDTGRCLEVNEAGLALFGYRREEVIGQTTITLGLWPTPDDRASFFARLAAEGALQNIELRFYAKDRTPRHCLVSCEPIELDGTPCLVTVGTDITEQKRATEALHLSEQHLKSIIETSPECVKLVGSDGTLLQINAAGLAMIEADRAEDVLGRNVYDLVAPSHRDAFQAMNERVCCGSKESLVFEVIGLRGTPRWMETHAVPLRNPADGGVVHLAIARDITERKRTEDALRQQEHTLQQAREERERISQDLHDNILQSLYAVGMQLEASKIVAGKSARKAKTHITHAVDQLNQLVQEVRHFIALLRKRDTAELDFGLALRQLVASFSSTDHTGPTLDIAPSAISLIRPEVGEQLFSIAREALSNSVRHARAAHRSVALRLTGTTIQLCVCDDGIGFNPGSADNRGQGLANIAARAKHIGARLTLSSSPGKGTCVTIEVPGEQTP
ncbi:PAS domain-containing sensor histidine kinase [Nitrospira sp. NS4]|uniref:PAS domain-containing sensor histidine kinase n=1 Tax=Nitrospira sp. NS4 TaxID=3414498 RepID=UPI003C2EF100